MTDEQGSHYLDLMSAIRENKRLRDAGQALIDDVKRRHPGEELHCEYMRALDDALRAK